MLEEFDIFESSSEGRGTTVPEDGVTIESDGVTSCLESSCDDSLSVDSVLIRDLRWMRGRGSAVDVDCSPLPS